MSDNAERLWLQDSLNQTSIKRAAEAINRLGKALPCQVTAVKGSIVTVSFEVSGEILPPVTIPKGEGQWIRSPTQVGDYGLTMPADVYLGGISGLGGSTANTIRRGNLTALQWIPTASTSFPGVNTNAAYIAGPEGAIIQTEDGTTVLTVGTAGVTITTGEKTWTFSAAGLTMSDGLVAELHGHGGVVSGGSVTTGPVAV